MFENYILFVESLSEDYPVEQWHDGPANLTLTPHLSDKTGTKDFTI